MDIKSPRGPEADSPHSSFVSVSPAASITTTTTGIMDDEPPPYSSIVPQTDNEPHAAAAQDPRSSSTQSLVPPESAQDGRRQLLLIYIHGFMGNETSFQGFPAHVHNVVSMLLAESHIVHTKIYPRYRSKKAIQVATSDFSTWLSPHLTSYTDVVLLGHSMGGLLSAEVVLLPTVSPESDMPLKHRILGTVSFDTPFLGMHPGVIRSGIGSIFRPAPTPPPSSPGSDVLSQTSSATSGQPADPRFNPAFPNDVNLPIRKGWSNALHFITKHSNNLRQATKQLVTSHIEFGSCLADFDGLKVRYCRIRMLEEDDEQKRRTVIEDIRPPPRVRFVNYYTASTGRPKKVKTDETVPAQPDSAPSLSSPPPSSQTLPLDRDLDTPSTAPPSYAGHEDDLEDDESILSSLADLDELDPMEDLGTAEYTESNPSLVDLSSPGSPDSTSKSIEMPDLPTRPSMPPRYADFPNDRAAYKAAEKAYKVECKDYGNALKSYYKLLAAYRKQEAQRLRHERKAALDVAAEERKIEMELRKEEAQRIAEAADAETRRREIEAMRERRKREFDLRRDQLKTSLEEEKQRRIEAARAQVKEGKQAIKRDLKAYANETKAYKKDIKHQAKTQKAEQKHARKIQSKSMSSCSSKSLPQGSPREGSMSERDNSISEFDSGKIELSESGDYFNIASPAESSSTPTRAVDSLRKLNANGYPEDKKQAPSISSAAPTESSNTTRSDAEKPRKDKRFCVLPPKDSTGNPDPTWQRVYMEGVDEVGAHCGLFFPRGESGLEPLPGPGEEWSIRYRDLVNDVAQRVELWVLDDMTQRIVRAAEA